MASGLVVPSAIHWETFKGERLENLLYWLLDELGAKDLVWRAGSATGTAADGGRDIEATFYLSTPEGGFSAERWWVQAKGRQRTVEQVAVQRAVLAADPTVDVVVIATNSRFSNPTRDWLQKHLRAHPRPNIRLWDKDALERLVVRHPSVVARLTPEALSPQGRLDAARSRFWNHAQLVGKKELETSWNERFDLSFDTEAMVALTVAEVANGNIEARPWPMELPRDAHLKILLTLALNTLPLALRFEQIGAGTDMLAEAAAYLVGVALVSAEPEAVVELLADPYQFADKSDSHDGARAEAFRKIALPAIIERFRRGLAYSCESDCVRVSASAGKRVDGRWISPDDVSFFDRWRQSAEGAPAGADIPEETLIIEDLRKPCRAGLTLGRESSCPLFASEDMAWESLIRQAATIIRTRLDERAR